MTVTTAAPRSLRAVLGLRVAAITLFPGPTVFRFVRSDQTVSIGFATFILGRGGAVIDEFDAMPMLWSWQEAEPDWPAAYAIVGSLTSLWWLS